MAGKPQANPEVERLIGRIAATRGELGGAVEQLGRSVRQRLDVPARVRGSMARHPKWWFGGSVALGLLASLRVFRRREVRPAASGGSKGLGKWLLGVAGAAAKPLIRDWIVRKSRQKFESMNHP